MDEASARAMLVDLADTSASPALTATLPRHAVEQALSDDDGPMDLVLDVTRYADASGTEIAGTRKIALSWERAELEDLLHRSHGDSITMVFDGEAVLRMLDPEFEAHGMREAMAVLAVAIAAGGVASAATAYPAESTGASAGPTIEQVAPGAAIEAVRSAAQATPAATGTSAASGIEAVRSAEPLAASADTGSLAAASGIEAVRSAEPLAASADSGSLAAGSGIEAVRSAEPLTASSGSGSLASADAIEAVRSAEPLAASADSGSLAAASGIEAVRSAEPLAGSAGSGSLTSASAIESVRSAEAAATRTPSPADGGIALSMPSPETTTAIVGGFLLLITGAMFVARSKRHELRLP